MKNIFHDCGVISRYREYLPVTDATPVISLSEGSTPLIHSPKLSEITGGEGEDLVEKQNAEQGQMPIVEDEAGIYGYIGENRHMVECFRYGRRPIETFEDGVEVVRMVMALYKSAETGRTIQLADEDLDGYVPVPAR